MTPTRLPGPLFDRDVDVLDLAVIEALLLQSLGPNSDAMTLERPGDGSIRVHLSPLGRATLVEMTQTVDPEDVDGWMLLLTVGLVEDVVAAEGAAWRAEAELGVELAAAERVDDVAALAQLAAAGPLVLDGQVTLTDVVRERVLDPDMVAFV